VIDELEAKYREQILRKATAEAETAEHMRRKAKAEADTAEAIHKLVLKEVSIHGFPKIS
jgi:hypothetical protein